MIIIFVLILVRALALVLAAVALAVPTSVTTRITAFLLTLGIFWSLADTLRQRAFLDFLPEEMLYLLELIDICIADEGDGCSVTIRTGRTSDTVHLVLSIVGYVVVNHRQDIIDVDATRHDIRCHEHIHLSGLETIHHLITLLLR